MLAIVLATALAQAWPPPPPPGYYAPPPGWYPPPPPAWVVRPPPPPPPPAYVQPAPAWQAPPPVVYPAAARYLEPRRQLGLVWLPLAGSTFSPGGYGDGDFRHGQLALELRGPSGGGRLRLGLEYATYGAVADFGLKYGFNEEAQLRPFLAAGAGWAWIDGNGSSRLCASLGAGVDFFITRNVFLTAELRGRVFSQPTGGSTLDGRGSGLSQATALFGVGVFL